MPVLSVRYVRSVRRLGVHVAPVLQDGDDAFADVVERPWRIVPVELSPDAKFGGAGEECVGHVLRPADVGLLSDQPRKV
jgi:hypothetical protein